MSRWVACLVSIVSSVLASSARADQMFNAAGDFSATSNPNGVWSYGQSATLTSAFQIYTQHGPDNADPIPGLNAWFGTSAYSVPAVLYNPTSSVIVHDSITVQPGELFFHPGQADQFSVVRFTAPDTGTYSLSSAFSPVDSMATTDVHVLLDNASIFDGLVNHSPTSFATVLSLTAGDVLEFKVGYGANGNYSNDSTGLDVRLTEATATPVPSSLAMLAGAAVIAGIGAIVRRRGRSRALSVVGQIML